MGGKLRRSEWVLIVAILIMALATMLANSQRPGRATMREAPRASALVDLDVPL